MPGSRPVAFIKVSVIVVTAPVVPVADVLMMYWLPLLTAPPVSDAQLMTAPLSEIPLTMRTGPGHGNGSVVKEMVTHAERSVAPQLSLTCA